MSMDDTGGDEKTYEAPEVEDTGSEDSPAVTAAGDSPPPDSPAS